MQTRTFGALGWKVSLLGLGCAPIMSRLGKRPSEILLRDALEAGINFYDTAPIYGQGQSEMLLGRAVIRHRSEVFICTKVGQAVSPAVARLNFLKPIVRPFVRRFRSVKKTVSAAIANHSKVEQYDEASIVSSVEGSLRRLKTDYLDLILLHGPRRATIESQSFLAPLEKLKAQGKIKGYGISFEGLDDLDACLTLPVHSIAAVQCEVNWSNREKVGPILSGLAGRNIAVIARSPFGGGRVLESRTPAEALQYVAGLSGVSVILAGMTKPNHLHDNVLALRLPDQKAG